MKAAGQVTLAEVPTVYHTEGEGMPVRLDWLTDDTETLERISVEDHAECSGHALYVVMAQVATRTDVDGNTLTEEEVDQRLDVEMEARNDSEERGDGFFPSTKDIGVTTTWSRQAEALGACSESNRHQNPLRSNGRDQSDQPVTEEDREAAKAERKRVLTNYAAWRAAEDVRRGWLPTFATRKTSPKGAEHYIVSGYSAPMRCPVWIHPA